MNKRRLLSILTSLAAASPALGQAADAPTRLWFDANGDALPDLYVFAPGTEDVLLRNLGNGAFEDATATAGLTGLRSRSAAVSDLDGDGDQDLARLALDGSVHLHLAVGEGIYEDVTHAFGLAGRTAARLTWTDYDADARDDLELFDEAGATRLFHNRDGLVFDEVVLRLPVPPLAGGPSTVPGGDPSTTSTELAGSTTAERSGTPDTVPPPRAESVGRRRPVLPERAPAPEGRANGPQTLGTSGTPLGPAAQILPCAPSLADVGGGLCLEGSSTPELGKLYPLSQDLLVRPTGEVTVGLAPGLTPLSKLHVDGGAWFQEPAFFNAHPLQLSAGVTAYGMDSLYRGYLAVEGSFVPFFSGAWAGRDIGVAGISIDGGVSDNYGVLARSNNKAVRAENDAFSGNWAELGTRSEGLIASGDTRAAVFLNDTETYADAFVANSLKVGGFAPFASSDQLHVRSINDAVVRIEADYDNITETDQPALILSQDGGAVVGSLTFANGTNALLLDSAYAFGEMYFRQFDQSGFDNDWEFQNVTDVEARITDLGNLQLDGSVSSPATDLAEYYPLAEPVEPGDVVAFVGEGGALVQALQVDGQTPRLAGIVSSNPGLLLGLDATDETSTAVPPPALADDERYLGPEKELWIDRLVLHEIEENARAPLALSGRVPCKVSAENGPIRAGDLLTVARIPGHAAKAVGAAPVIGTALQSHAAGTGKIVVLAGLGWYSPDDTPRIEALEREVADLKRSLQAIARPR